MFHERQPNGKLSCQIHAGNNWAQKRWCSTDMVATKHAEVMAEKRLTGNSDAILAAESTYNQLTHKTGDDLMNMTAEQHLKVTFINHSRIETNSTANALKAALELAAGEQRARAGEPITTLLCRTTEHSLVMSKMLGTWFIQDSMHPIRTLTDSAMRNILQGPTLEIYVGQPTEAYIEQQIGRMCLTHAVNNSEGSHVLDGQQMIDYGHTLKTTLEQRIAAAKAALQTSSNNQAPDMIRAELSQHFRQDGYFSVALANLFWASGKAGLKKHLHECTPRLLTRATAQAALPASEALGNTTHLILTLTEGGGHAVSLRHREGEWYTSQAQEPQPVNWDTLQGQVQNMYSIRLTLPEQAGPPVPADLRLADPVQQAPPPSDFRARPEGQEPATSRQERRRKSETRAARMSKNKLLPRASAPCEGPPGLSPLDAEDGGVSVRAAKAAEAKATQNVSTSQKTATHAAPAPRKPTPTPASAPAQASRPSKKLKTQINGQQTMMQFLPTAKENRQAADVPAEVQTELPAHPANAPAKRKRNNANETTEQKGSEEQLVQGLILCTHNIQGGMTARGKASRENEMRVLMQQCKPDILAITETNHSGAELPNWLKRQSLQGYTVYHSAHNAAGVILAVKDHVALVTQMKPCKHTHTGRLVACTMTHSTGKILLAATYWPAGSSREALTERAEMAETLRALLADHPNHVPLIMGDMNATWEQGDRSSNTEQTQDHAYRKTMLEQGLGPLRPPGSPRPHTYTRPVLQNSSNTDEAGKAGVRATSRIDDILTSEEGNQKLAQLCSLSVHQLAGLLSDHAPLTAHLELSKCGIHLPAPPPEPTPTAPRPKLQLPVKPKDLEHLISKSRDPAHGITAMATKLRAEITPMHMEAVASLATCTDGRKPGLMTHICGQPVRQAVEQTAGALMDMVDRFKDLALKELPTTMTNPGGTHYRKRQVTRKRQACSNTLGATRYMQEKLDRSPEMGLPELTHTMQAAARNGAQRSAIDQALQLVQETQARSNEQGAQPDLRREVDAAGAAAKQQIRSLDEEEGKEEKAKAAGLLSKIFQKVKSMGKWVFRKETATEAQGLKALMNPATGMIETSPLGVVRIAQKLFKKQLRAPAPKTGKYLPEERRKAPYPFQLSKAQDRFTLCTSITEKEKLGQARQPLHATIMDFNVFQDKLSHLSNNKAPGPDGIENEILKMLPYELRDMLHQLFVIMWATRVTPTAWKESETILLYKQKGEATDLKMYRPVGLTNTVYKLWTSLTAHALAEYAEQNGLLTTCQSGFRQGRGTTEPLQAQVMAAEDAMQGNKNLYALVVDFTSAFNTTDHDLQLSIMYDYGFPTDAIEVVRDLYTDASTRIKACGLKSDPIAVERGTIQGDSLSPLLFLIYIDPLLRWMQVGGRGYQHTCMSGLSQENQLKRGLSALAYADDLTCLTGNVPDLMVQAEKLSQYADWAYLQVSGGKTLVTGIAHGQARTGDGKGNAAEIARCRLEGLVHVQPSINKQPIPFLPPDQAFRYLGVDITLTLDWRPQLARMTADLRHQLACITRSCISARQALCLIRTMVIPKLAYSFPVTACSPADIGKWDSMITSAVKKKSKLMMCAPSAMMRQDTLKFGLGVTSVAVEYHHRNGKALSEALNEYGRARGTAEEREGERPLPGRYAMTTMCLLDTQLHSLTHQLRTETHRSLQRRLNCCLRVRQLIGLHKADIKLVRGAEDRWGTQVSAIERAMTEMREARTHDQLAEMLQQMVNSIMRPLMEAGISEPHALLQADKKHLMNGRDMQRKYGKKGMAPIIALNRLAATLRLTERPNAEQIKQIMHKPSSQLVTPASNRLVAEQGALISAAWLQPLLADLGQWTWDTTYRPEQRTICSYFAPQSSEEAEVEKPSCNTRKRNIEQANMQPRIVVQAARQISSLQGTSEILAPRSLQPNQLLTFFDDSVTKALPKGHNNWQEETWPNLAPANSGKKQVEQARTQIRRTLDKAVQIRTALYDDANAITRILAVTIKQGVKHLLVEWQDTVMERNKVKLFELTGYKVRAITPLTRGQANLANKTCQICAQRSSSALPTCESCQRCYHSACLTACNLQPPAAQAAAHWHCPACEEVGPATKEQRREAADMCDDSSQMVRVEWEPTEEPEDMIMAHTDMREIYETYLREEATARSSSRQPPARDAMLSAMDRQAPCLGETFRAGDHSQNLFIDRQATNPQFDIMPTLSCEVKTDRFDVMSAPCPPQEAQDNSQTGTATQGLPPAPPLPTYEKMEVSVVYGPDGKHRGLIEPDMAAVLLHRYEEAAKAGMHDGMKPEGFAPELAGLLERYPDLMPAGESACKAAKKHWGSSALFPASLKTALRRMGVTKERCCSPLQAHADMEECHGMFERDKLFGAHTQPMDKQFTGLSICYVPHNSKDMSKAVKHALLSANTAQTASPVVPTATFFLLPMQQHQSSAHMQWVKEHPGQCKVLALSSLTYQMECDTPRVWKGARQKTGQSMPRAQLVVVWNQEAKDKLEPQIAHMITSLNYLIPPAHSTRRATHSNNLQPLPGTTKHAHMPTDTLTPCTTSMRISEEDMSLAAHELQRRTGALQGAAHLVPKVRNWWTWTYTDGSCRTDKEGKQSIGAGVFKVSPEGQQLALLINPGGEELTNTITRAEVAAVVMALIHGATHIGVDSMAAIYQIWKAAKEPQKMRCHKHIDLLMLAAKHIRQSPVPIYLFKVKAHAGVIGNEGADVLAVKAASPGAIHDAGLAPQPNPYKDLWWPQQQKAGSTNRPYLLSDLGACLKQAVHDAYWHGNANRLSIYFRMWCGTLDDGYTHANHVNLQVSNHFMGSSSVSAAQRLTIIRTRMGVLFNQKLAKRMGLAPNCNCPLCHQPDSAEHMISGCRAASKLVTARHHGAGRLMTNAIAKGSKGAALVYADVGSEVNLNKDGLTNAELQSWADLRAWLFGQAMALRTRKRRREAAEDTPATEPRARESRPDIVLVEMKPGRSMADAALNAVAAVHIVELKYCSDTRWQDRQKDAEEQHRELVQALKNRGLEVHLHTIVLGTAGSIYNQMQEQMKKLGLSRDQTLKLGQKLNIHAATHAHALVAFRRHGGHPAGG